MNIYREQKTQTPITESKLNEILRSELKDKELFNEISYEDKLDIGYPAVKKKTNKLLSDTPERVDAFYYYHLSPLIRESILQV